MAQATRKKVAKGLTASGRYRRRIDDLEQGMALLRQRCKECEEEAERSRIEAAEDRKKRQKAEGQRDTAYKRVGHLERECHRLEGENNRLVGYIRRVREERGEIPNSLDPMPGSPRNMDYTRNLERMASGDTYSTAEWWESEEKF